jgi:hypothetical protein
LNHEACAKCGQNNYEVEQETSQAETPLIISVSSAVERQLSARSGDPLNEPELLQHRHLVLLLPTFGNQISSYMVEDQHVDDATRRECFICGRDVAPI